MKVETRPLGDGYFRIERGRASVGIDLWPCSLDLSPEGQVLCEEIIRRYVDRFFEGRGRGSVSSGAGATFIGISRLLPEDRDACLDELLAVVLANLQSLKWPWEGEAS